MTSVPFLIAQNIKVTNWLTPVWLISLGITIGFIFVLLMMAKILIFQRVKFFNTVSENSRKYTIFGLLTGGVYFGLFTWYLSWKTGSLLSAESVMPLCFAFPISMFVGFGVWRLVARRMIGETSGLFREGFLGWVNKVCIAMVVFTILGFFLASNNGFGFIKFVDQPNELVQSLKRLPFTGRFEKSFTVPASTTTDGGTAVDVGFIGAELRIFGIQSNERLEMAVFPINETATTGIVEIQPGSEEMILRQRIDGRGPIPLDQIDQLYFRYMGKEGTETSVNISWLVTPVYQEVGIIPSVAVFVFAIYLLYLVFATMCPKVFAIAHSTFKTEVNQPLYLLVLVIGALFTVGSIYVPYNTFGEDIKMYKDSGLTLIRVLAIFLAIWAASKSVAEEIEGRTALTVLSKPVGRRQFIFGKVTGISLAIAVMFIVLGLWFVIWTSYKPIYDYQEASKGICEWPECFVEAVNVIPGVFLCFLEVLIFVTISVAISTRLGILANFLICFSIYVLGHLTPLLVQSSLAEFEPVVVFGNLIAIVFPVLNHFDIQAAINTNSSVPYSYMGWSIIYTFLYGSMAMLLALVLFEDRDLA
jgi:ABC-type transport system involved in multi-copper enzyme maturation permease subunit